MANQHRAVPREGQFMVRLVRNKEYPESEQVLIPDLGGRDGLLISKEPPIAINAEDKQVLEDDEYGHYEELVLEFEAVTQEMIDEIKFLNSGKRRRVTASESPLVQPDSDPAVAAKTVESSSGAVGGGTTGTDDTGATSPGADGGNATSTTEIAATTPAPTRTSRSGRA